jgi:DNA-binding MarR family transcriptional regulator
MRRLKRVVIREELVALTGNFVQAILLGQFLYWTSRVKDFDSFLEEESRITGKKTDHLKRHGWIYKSAHELKEETMLPVSLQTIRNHLRELVQKGWLEERKNPNNKWDKTLQYRVNLKKIQQDLLLMGYPLEGWEILKTNLKILESKTKNLESMSKNRESESNSLESKPNNLEAIPEITTENITETTTERESTFTPPAEEKVQPKNFEIRKLEQAGDGEKFDEGKRKANKVHSKYVSPYTKRIVEVFKHHYMNKFGCPPAIYPKAIERLEEQLKFLNDGAEKAAFVDKAIEVIPNYLNSDDYFVKHKVNYSFSGFVSQLPKLLSSCKELTESEEKPKKIDIGIEGVECYEGL